MLDAVIQFLSTGDVELIKPYLSSLIQNKLAQEVFAWGLLYKFFILKDLKKGVSEEGARWREKVSGIELALKELTETIGRVEAGHFSSMREANNRLDRQGEVQKDVAIRVSTLDNLIIRLTKRVQWNTDIIKDKLGVIPPHEEEKI